MTKYLLHIDTSTDTGTIAIGSNGTILAYRTNNDTRNHAGTINNMIQAVLADVSILFSELSAIVVCGGPGSYTGLRIGMATAKGLCYALDIPMILDNRLTLLAYKAYTETQKQYGQYISLLTAREKEYFISIYDKDFSCTFPPQHIAEEQLLNIVGKNEKTYMLSNAPDNVINNCMITNLQIDTNIELDLKSWGYFAFSKYNCNNIVNLATAEPFYLKQVYTHK